MNITRLRKRALKAGVAVPAIALLGLAAPAHAQADDPIECPDADDDGVCDDETTLTGATGEDRPDATIVVTGSRIRRDEFSSPAPLTVVDPELAVRQGLMDTGSMVQGSPIAAGSAQITAALSGQYLANGGSGVQTISLRGLGAERTLVLLNSRRAGPAGTRGAVSAFDLNVLPQSIVERVEILKDGASSIYGSDAVAGVVNLITKTDTDGLEFDLFGSAPFKSGGETFSAAATWGKTFERGHVMVSGNLHAESKLVRRDRDYLQCGEAYVFTDLDFETRADLIDPRTGEFACSSFAESNLAWGHIWSYDYSYIYSPTGQSNLPTGGGLAFLQYNYPGDNLGAYIPRNTPPQDPYQLSIPPGWYAIGYDPASEAVANSYHPLMDNNTVEPKLERYTLYVDAAYELASFAEVYTELLYNKRKTAYDSSRQVWQFGPGENDLGATDFLFGFGGALGPIGDPLANGFSGFALYSPTAFINSGDFSQEVDYYRGVAGVRGDIISSWSYDLYGQYSKSDATYTNERILQDVIDSQDFRGTPLGAAPSPCEGTGYVTPISNRQCVDVDWYSSRVMAGHFTADEFSFLTGTETGTTDYTQWYVEGVVTGELFELPGGPLGLALGGTFRRDEIEDIPGAITLANNAWQSGGAGITAGRSDTWEAFGEIDIPLLADLPLIQSLRVTGAGRVTSVKATRASDGASDSDNGNWTYRVAGDWAVSDWLRFRGTYGTSFRAPALFEQFLADQEGALSQRAIDPCQQWGIALAQGAITQRFADNCAADGVPPNHIGSGIDATVIQGGGLGVLEAETSTAWTASVILTPSFGFLPDTAFSLAVDYFDIEVSGEIAQFGAPNVIAQCYASDFYPDSEFCSLFARIGDLDPSNPYWNAGNPNNVAFARDSFININSQSNEGVDVTARMVHDFPGDITLTLQGQMTWQTQDTISVFEGEPENLNGEAGEPKWVGDFFAQLDSGPWSLHYGLDVVGSTDDVQDYVEANTNTGLPFDELTQDQINDTLCDNLVVYPGEVCYKLKIPATFYHTVSVTREVGDYMRITAGVSNLFDTHPPRVSDVGGNGINNFGKGVLYSQYDLLGRRGFVNINLRY